MEFDSIAEIGIDELERLYVKPTKASFPLLYREAMEVQWDPIKRLLHSPKPREWDHFDWYCQIIKAVTQEQLWSLSTTPKTKWSNISNELKLKIENWSIPKS
jgi:hypothetical protein